MIEAVIFDLDGVLVSTDERHFEAWERLAEILGISGFTRKDNERQRGVSRMASLEVVLEKSNVTYSDDEKQGFAHLKNDLYVESLKNLSENDLLPGAIQTIMTLKAKGIKIALGSASKNAELILRKVGLFGYFDAIACGNDTNRSKPDPEVFLVASKKLGIVPENCLVIEDAAAGIEAAKVANMQSFGVGPAAQDPKADWRANDLEQSDIDWETILG